GFGTTGFSFGSTPATAPSFSLGTTTTPTNSGFSFGGLTSSTAPSGATGGFGFGTGFGTTPATSTTTTMAGTNPFGGFGTFGSTMPTTTTQSFQLGGLGAKPLFGQPQTTTTSLAKPLTTATTGGFGGFRTGLGGSTFGTGLGQPQQQPVQTNPLEALYNAVFNCNVYGDEPYYSQTAPPLDLTPQNPLCRFKAIGYSCMPSSDNAQGLVQQQLITSLNMVLGNKPNLTVTVEGIKPISEAKTQVVIYVQEKSVTGVDLEANPRHRVVQLPVDAEATSHNSGGRQRVPSSIDPRLWKQAQLDNPNPEKYIPVPMVGFEEVRWRMKCQEQETRLHQSFLDGVAEDIAELQRRHTATVARIAEYRRKFLELEHRVLQVLVKQEVSRKVGLALQPEEEVLRSQLEALQNQLNAPAQFKGQVSELLSQMRLQRQEAAHREVERYSMDPAVQDDIKQVSVLYEVCF
ncbi:putative nucleoporin Nup54, partial [Blattella germanica]